jgi:hypothetical protein
MLRRLVPHQKALSQKTASIMQKRRRERARSAPAFEIVCFSVIFTVALAVCCFTMAAIGFLCVISYGSFAARADRTTPSINF